MRYLSISIKTEDGFVKRRLPWRRPWERKSKIRKKISWDSSFVAPHNQDGLATPSKSANAILVHVVVEYKNVPITNDLSGHRIFKTIERETRAGLIVLDFDQMPDLVSAWPQLVEKLRERLTELGVDGIFVTSAGGKTKLLVPVIHDLKGIGHGTTHERLLASIALAGERWSPYIDPSPAASRTAFFTRGAAEEFLCQTMKPLRPASLKDLVERSQQMSVVIQKKNSVLEKKVISDKKSAETSSPDQTTASAEETRGYPLTTRETPYPMTHGSSLREGARRLAAQLLQDATGAEDFKKRGRPARAARGREEAILAALLLQGGAATLAEVFSRVEGLRGNTPRRSFDLSLKNLMRRGIVERMSGYIPRVRSQGLMLSRAVRSDEKTLEFYNLAGTEIFPKDGSWNDHLFRLTGLFSSFSTFISHAEDIPGFFDKPERREQAETAWRNHERRRKIARSEADDISKGKERLKA
jgi:hypothetical protein